MLVAQVRFPLETAYGQRNNPNRPTHVPSHVDLAVSISDYHVSGRIEPPLGGRRSTFEHSWKVRGGAFPLDGEHLLLVIDRDGEVRVVSRDDVVLDHP